MLQFLCFFLCVTIQHFQVVYITIFFLSICKSKLVSFPHFPFPFCIYKYLFVLPMKFFSLVSIWFILILMLCADKINVLNTGIISAQTGLKFCKTIRLSSQFLKAFQWENSHLIDRWRKEIIFHFLPGASRDKTRMNNIFIT